MLAKKQKSRFALPCLKFTGMFWNEIFCGVRENSGFFEIKLDLPIKRALLHYNYSENRFSFLKILFPKEHKTNRA
jgi:hypothetical protein